MKTSGCELSVCVLVLQVSEPLSVELEEQMPAMSHSVVTLLTAHRHDREKHIPASRPLCVCMAVHCSIEHQRRLSGLLSHWLFSVDQMQTLFSD